MTLAIDRYTVQRLLGQGAMGKVYLATDPKLGREVAIKVLSSATDNAQIKQRFRMEARAIASLKHPNIVELYDYSGEGAADLFLVMEYVPGRRLTELVTERGPMSEPTALCVAHELCLALLHAHGNGVVHRDLKPDNVLLHQGRVVLMDFGVVKAIASGGALRDYTAHTRGQALGTPGFMAPEQIRAQKVDGRTDIFAVGATLFYLVTGSAPFEGKTLDEVIHRTLAGDSGDIAAKNPMLSPGFLEIIEVCLAASPGQRFKDAAALRERIIEVLRAHGVTEVRSELTSYDENPAQHSLDQRNRAVDVLMRDLKLAIKDRDEKRVQHIVERMQVVAPLGRRMRDVTGLRWEVGKKPRLTRERRPSRLLWFGVGSLVGLALGATTLFVLQVLGRLPAPFLTEAERLVHLVADRLR